MKKVAIVRITQIVKGEELRNDVRCFKTKELAKTYAKEFIADEMEYVKRDGWVVEDEFEESGTWQAYEAGYYNTNHTELVVSVETIHEE